MRDKDQSPEAGTPLSLGDLPPEFAGFDRIYEQEIRPSLMAREVERVAAAQKAIQTRWIGGAIIAAGVGIGFALLKLPVVAIIVGILGFGVIGWGNMGISRLAGEA